MRSAAEVLKEFGAMGFTKEDQPILWRDKEAESNPETLEERAGYYMFNMGIICGAYNAGRINYKEWTSACRLLSALRYGMLVDRM